jgi:hypothetical protein
MNTQELQDKLLKEISLNMGMLGKFFDIEDSFEFKYRFYRERSTAFKQLAKSYRAVILSLNSYFLVLKNTVR